MLPRYFSHFAEHRDHRPQIFLRSNTGASAVDKQDAIYPHTPHPAGVVALKFGDIDSQRFSNAGPLAPPHPEPLTLRGRHRTTLND